MRGSSTCGGRADFYDGRMATIHRPFKYVPALQTDIRQTFRREWQRLREQEQAKRDAEGKVTPITRERARPSA